MYTEKQKKKLLNLARDSIEEEFTKKKVSLLEFSFPEKRGVFVTLTKNKKLRGCIGFPYPEFSLNEAVYRAAKSAAFYDPRFLSVEKNELKDIKIEISVLSIPEECNIYGIKIPGDGLMCEIRGSSGLLLPLVATECKMNKQEFLEALCEKAGLSKNAYEEEYFRLFKFQCEIFHE